MMQTKSTPISENKNSALIPKIFAAIIPAFILTQELAWITANGTGLVWFWIFYFVIVLSIIRWEKNRALARIFRIAQIAAFFAPVAVIVMTLVLSAQQGNDVVMVIAGLMGTFITAIVALFFGFIFRSIANSFAKKSSVVKEQADTKKCPDCAELIKADAKKCRYCGKVFEQ